MSNYFHRKDLPHSINPIFIPSFNPVLFFLIRPLTVQLHNPRGNYASVDGTNSSLKTETCTVSPVWLANELASFLTGSHQGSWLHSEE